MISKTVSQLGAYTNTTYCTIYAKPLLFSLWRVCLDMPPMFTEWLCKNTLMWVYKINKNFPWIGRNIILELVLHIIHVCVREVICKHTYMGMISTLSDHSITPLDHSWWNHHLQSLYPTVHWVWTNRLNLQARIWTLCYYSGVCRYSISASLHGSQITAGWPPFAIYTCDIYSRVHNIVII